MQRCRQAVPRASVSSPGEGRVACLPSGGEVKRPAERTDTPPAPRPGPGPSPACSPCPGLGTPEGLKALPLYLSPGPLPEACPGAEGCPVPRGPRLLGTKPRSGKKCLFPRLLSWISGDPTAKCGHRNTAAATKLREAGGSAHPQRVDGDDAGQRAPGSCVLRPCWGPHAFAAWRACGSSGFHAEMGDRPPLL